jgi:hypothetical protein
LAVEADEDEDEDEEEEEVYQHPGRLTENNYGSGEAFIAKPPSPSPQALIVPEPELIVAQLAPPLPAAAAASGASQYGNGSFPPPLECAPVLFRNIVGLIRRNGVPLYAGEASELDALLAASSALAAEAEQLMAEVLMTFFFFFFFFSHPPPLCPRNATW